MGGCLMKKLVKLGATDRLWRCPKCGEEQWQPRIAKPLGHRCTHNRNRWEPYELVEEDK